MAAATSSLPPDGRWEWQHRQEGGGDESSQASPFVAVACAYRKLESKVKDLVLSSSWVAATGDEHGKRGVLPTKKFWFPGSLCL